MMQSRLNSDVKWNELERNHQYISWAYGIVLPFTEHGVTTINGLESEDSLELPTVL